MRFAFAPAAFAAAALLFAVQPMAGKAVLPSFGGSPAVWTTCLLFFQGVLLLGYLYAHAIGRLTTRRQVFVHAVVLALGGGTRLLAIHFNWADATPFADSPVPGVLTRLAALALGPAFALSATAPLIQRWFAAGWPGKNPYALYAASNAGSFVGLLAYPFVIEPRLDLDQQAGWWLLGYALAGLLVLTSGFLALSPSPLGGEGLGVRGESPKENRPNQNGPVESNSDRLTPQAVHSDIATSSPWARPSPPTHLPRGERGAWIALAALPSSLLGSVTTHLTTDIAPVPLLWVVPLALYLISFIVAFGRWPGRAQRGLGRATPMALTFLTVALITKATDPVVGVAAVHLISFLMVATLCHGELARTKPDPSRLTAFYLWLAAGGVLGGFFNAVVAPLIFARLGPLEYPLAVCLAALVRPPLADNRRPRWIGWDDGKWLVGLAVLALSLTLLIPRYLPVPEDSDDVSTMLTRLARYGLTAGLPACVAFALVWRPGRFAVALSILFLVAAFDPSAGSHLITLRNSLGTLRVSESADGKYVRITHGTTLHGQQVKGESPPKPLMYYHPTGPAGRLLNLWPAERRKRVGAVGLGCGALAGYGQPGESWTFFELDPNVIRVAEDPQYFTFLSTCKATVRTVCGDARLKLNAEPDGTFDVLILDAFNSDAVPTHLLTTEAFDLYFRKLAPGGVLLIHASNRYLDLPNLIIRTAGGRAMKQDYDIPTDGQRADGKFPSHWLVVARTAEDLAPLTKDLRWQRTDVTPGPVWTDRFTDLLGIWKRSED